MEQIQKNDTSDKINDLGGKLKKEHQIVLDATEIANLGLTRGVTVAEIIQALTPRETKILKKTYPSSNFSSSISKILSLLIVKKKIFKAGKIGKRNCYAVVGVLSSEEADVSNLTSRRGKTLELVRDAVTEAGRALRMGEIKQFARKTYAYSHLDKTNIALDISSLKDTGDLEIIPIRGDSKGHTLYLPPDFKIDDYLPEQPVTWLEFILDIFGRIWEEHIRVAEDNNTLPLPIITGEIRAEVADSGRFSEKLRNPKDLISALQQLSRKGDKSIRRIKRRGQKAIFWVPKSIAENEINLGQAYANDTERLEEAVKRASINLDRPVNTAEVQNEIDNDASLKPMSDVRIYTLLADMSRNHISREGKTKQRKLTYKIHRLGTIGGRAYFHPTKEQRAVAYIKFQKALLKWDKLKPFEEIGKIEGCLLGSVAYGRLLLLQQGIDGVSKKIKGIKSADDVLDVSNKAIKEINDEITEIERRIKLLSEILSSEYNFLPDEVDNKCLGLTVEEVRTYLEPFYPRAANHSSETSLQAMLKDTIKRFPNPDFTYTSDDNRRQSAKYLYDRADTLFRIANQWGGIESGLQAGMAYNELGSLRDARFVVPALDEADFNKKLAAVACVAFLSPKSGLEKIRDMAEHEAEYGVRQSSLWAYGLMTNQNEEAVSFIMERSLRDEDERVRKFAQELVEKSDGEWLFI